MAFRLSPGCSVLRVYLLAFMVALGSGAAAQETNTEPIVGIGAPSAWVRPLMHSGRRMEVEAGRDRHWLLSERQIHVAQNETFAHSVWEVLTLSGVQNNATLSFDFDPTYEKLTLHWVRIWRGRTVRDALDRQKLKLIQPERDLQEFLYRGRRSAVLILEDVRVGDIVDYACSRKGVNPVFAGAFAEEIFVRFDESMERLQTRLLWPEKRRLYAKAHNCSVTPAVTRTEDMLEYTWDLARIPSMKLEDSLPLWYQPVPWIQLSEQQSWGQVNDWALGLFQCPGALSEPLQERIREFSRIQDGEQRVLAALRFVQDEVRYFGVEMGTGTHRPSDPSIVASRRFGDCKDKSLLLVSMLRSLNVPAYPVLVNTEQGRNLATWHPSAIAFNHAIVQVQWDRRVYWLDPTTGYQRGPLAAHYLPRYERGLVVRPGTIGLTEIASTTGLPTTWTTEYFQLRGMQQPADLKVVTVCEGRDADSMRAYFSATPRSDIEKDFLKDYAAYYPGTRVIRPIEFLDDDRRNRTQVIQYYVVDKIWASLEDNTYRCRFYPGTMQALLRRPRDTVRTSPLGMRYPERQVIRTEVVLPQAWVGYSKSSAVNDPAFAFRSNIQSRGNQLVMEYEYRSLNDWVSPGRMGEYLERLKEASDALGYAVYWP